jgi:hypothetical protein
METGNCGCKLSITAHLTEIRFTCALDTSVLRVLQHKIVVHHATGWDAQGVSNVACAQGAAKVQNKSELTGTRSQDTMH